MDRAFTEFGAEESRDSGSFPSYFSIMVVPRSSWLRGLAFCGDPAYEKPLEIVREILQSNLCPGPHAANGPKQLASHRGDLMAEDMFDAGADACPSSICVFLPSRQRRVPIPFVLNS